MPTQDELIRAIAQTAASWRDPEHGPRAQAVADTLTVDTPFTEESIAFAVNQAMNEVTEPALRAWVGGREAAQPMQVGVLVDTRVPLEGFYEFLAVLLTGHRYAGVLPEYAAYLLPAFAEEVGGVVDGLPVTFVDEASFPGSAGAVIAVADEDTVVRLREDCDAAGIPEGNRQIQMIPYGIAVLDGKETAEDLERLAEDLLLYEGEGCRSVKLVWAPAELSPDALLDALALFRSVFPVNPRIPRTLKMQQAFLQALKQSHAYGEEMEFLLSKGDPDPQPAGHVRWVPYERIDEVSAWLKANDGAVQHVVASPAAATDMDLPVPVLAPGDAHRPPIGWSPGGVDRLTFLTDLRSG